MAPKDKKAAAAGATEEAPNKKAKVEEEPKKEEPKEPAFEEPDAPKETRGTIKESVSFEPAEMTLNAIPTMGGKLLMAISEGGMAYLMSGARANVAQKGGRYMFEAKIVQTMTPNPGRGTPPRQLLRVGFSTSASTLMMGDDDTSICFDGDGSYISEKKRHPGKATIYRATVVGVVLNLDPKSPNFNTVALYCDGKKMSDPKPLPECLKGKPLYPHLCYRNLSVQVNFGPTPLAALPFKCRMLQEAAQPDVVVSASTSPKDGKYEVVMPVAFPDEGTFDWLDTWLEKNPQFVELSDRKIMDWARCSGLWSRTDRKGSNDKPNFNFGVPCLDDFSVRKLISIVAPIMPRNYVVMEVKSNLLAAERKETLKKFSNSCYKKVATVVMGEPNKSFKSLVHNKLLKDKQAKAEADWKVKKAELDRKKQIAKRQKELAAQRKEAEEKEKKAKEEKAAAKKKAEEEKKAKEDAEKKDEPEGEKAADEAAKEEEKKEEPKDEAKEEPKKEEAEEPEEPEEEMAEEPPAAELTEEEKATNFLPKKWPDLEKHVLNSAYVSFTTPDKSEGFDDIRYEWDAGDKAKEYLKTWVANKKLNTRIEDLKPGEVFVTKRAAFTKALQEWKEKLKGLEAAPKTEKKEGEDEEELDVFKVEDIMNVTEGRPLFEHFEDMDWALTALRFELHMVATSFKKDCNDPDRVGVPLDHASFYFYKYFNKMISAATFGMADNNGIFTLLKDTVAIKDGLLVTALDEDMDNFDMFLKLTESARRERSRRIEAGDETARLKFDPRASERVPDDIKGARRGGGKGDGKDRGGGKGDFKDNDSKGSQLCRLNQQGKCTYGTGCRYSHGQ